MKKYIFFFFLLTQASVFAQSGKLKKADNYYDKLAYSYAAPLYEELIGSEVDSPKLKGKLALCYYQTGNMEKAEHYFSQMIHSSEATENDYFYYAQSLKQNGKYAESDQWMQKVHAVNQADLRGKAFSAQSDYLTAIEKQRNHFSVNNLAINSAAADFGGYPSADGKTVYFVSARRKAVMVQDEYSWNSKRFLDIYAAQTDSTTSGLSDVSRLKGKVNTRFHEGSLCVAPDGKTVYFTRNNLSKGKKRKDQQGIQDLKLYRATIAENGKWINEEALPFNSKDYSVGHPSVSADGKTLYFVSDMPGGYGGADLYKIAIHEDGTFGTAENLGNKINTEGQEMFPWIAANGDLYFASNGQIGLGGLDIFVALATKKGTFSKIVNAGEPINTQYDDFGLTFIPNQVTGYFSSNRTGGKGDDDIYSCTLIKTFAHGVRVEGVVTDNRSQEILPGATVQLTDKQGNVLQSVTADANGKYTFDLEEGKDYALLVSKQDYFNNNGTLSTKNIDPDIEVLKKDLTLEKDPGLALYAMVKEAKSNQPLEGVTIKIMDKQKNVLVMDTLTSVSGDVLQGLAAHKIGDQLNYQVIVSKEGYMTKTVPFSYTITAPGIIKLNEKLDLTLQKMDVGTDLATLIDIKPIYFDLGKYAIRKDAAKELDKIVAVMNEYPKMVIELGSHTDCRGSAASNTKLSDNRAKASATYIKQRISNPERISGKGYGESRLKVDCPCEGAVKSTCPEEEHQKNRRTEFVIISM